MYFERKNLRYSGAAEYTGLSESYLRRLVYDGKIPFSKIGKAVVFNSQELDRWIDEQSRGGKK